MLNAARPLLLALTVVVVPIPARAATYTAASCSRADVQAALSQHLATPQDGDVVAIPAGNCTWTASITAIMQAGDSTPTIGYVANHGVTSGRNRSTRAFEYYRNNLSAPAPGLNKSPFPVNGGTGLVWGNTISQYRFVTSLNYTRKDNTTYGYGSPPSGWGNCNGTAGTVWDGSASPGAYPCLDQPGRGAGDLLTGSFPNISNTRTGSAAAIIQAISPIYVWANSLDPAGYDPIHITDVGAPAAMVQANRDYYQQFGTHAEPGTYDV